MLYVSANQEFCATRILCNTSCRPIGRERPVAAGALRLHKRRATALGLALTVPLRASSRIRGNDQAKVSWPPPEALA